MLNTAKIRDMFDVENAAEAIVNFKTKYKIEESYKIGLEQDVLMIFIIHEYSNYGTNVSLENVCKKVCNFTKEEFESLSFSLKKEDVNLKVVNIGRKMFYGIRQVVGLYMDLGGYNPIEDLKNRCLQYLKNAEQTK